ncbi:hypothetical protein SAMN04488539_1863 [Corynebacterium timonense]|uniref:Uncharacterized protein n=1 Tax=Corynebacterium timonense TaxID=441500 RepID=A0A1H1SZR7_9CORY|nr:hypothetical protein SAMN04488539_1863 [Corynebacterium timonense]
MLPPPWPSGSTGSTGSPGSAGGAGSSGALVERSGRRENPRVVVVVVVSVWVCVTVTGGWFASSAAPRHRNMNTSAARVASTATTPRAIAAAFEPDPDAGAALEPAWGGGPYEASPAYAYSCSFGSGKYCLGRSDCGGWCDACGSRRNWRVSSSLEFVGGS